MRALLWAVVVGLACTAHFVTGHEVRPAFLALEEVEPKTFTVLWKQPILGDRRLPIEPELPSECSRTPSTPPVVSNTAMLQRWRVF